MNIMWMGRKKVIVKERKIFRNRERKKERI